MNNMLYKYGIFYDINYKRGINYMIRYKVKRDVITDLSLYTPFKKKEVFIVKEDTDTGVWIPSKLSEYLSVYCKNDSPHTKYSKGLVITNFMNFLLDKVAKNEEPEFEILREKGLYGLKLIHATKYLNYISGNVEKQNNFSTVKKKENELVTFYYFLQNKGVIKGKDSKIETKIVKKKLANGHESKKGEKVLISPFHEKGSDLYITLPPKKPTAESGYKKRKPKLDDMKVEVFSLFLEYVNKEVPYLAFPIYIQCMGGLRCGEVVNLTVEDIMPDSKNNRIFLNIQDRQIELFGNKKSLESEVKFERENQVVLDFNNQLMNVMDRHLKNLAKNKNIECTPKGNRPLFVNDYNKPMTGEVYRNKFNVVRDNFIDWLRQYKATEAEYLDNHEWSTHIGRHLFTNYIIKMGICDNSLGEPDAVILASLRGDMNTQSAMNYISKRALLEAVDSTLAINWDKLLPQMGAYRNLEIVGDDKLGK